MMRYSIEFVSILYLIFITALKLLCFKYFDQLAYWTVLISWSGSVLAVFVKHNHCHLSIFRRRYPNFFMDIWLDLLTGGSCSSIKIIHIINHHRFKNESGKDWGSTRKFEAYGHLKGMLMYMFATPILFIRAKQKWLKSNKSGSIYKYNIVENLIIIVTYFMACIYDLQSGICILVLPVLLVQISLAAINYLQHYGHDSDTHSNNVGSHWFNVFFFNIGFHEEHHLYPQKHWSELGRKKNIHEAVKKAGIDK